MSNIFSNKIKLDNILKYAFPSILMQIFTSLYVIVDGTFVSRLVGSQALAATNITYPVISIIIAVAVMFATGGSAIVAKRLGEGNVAEAKESFTLLSIVAVLLGLILAVLSLIFIRPIIVCLEASGQTLEYGVQYLSTYLWFTPFLVLQMLFQVFFITAGKPTLGLSTTVMAGVTNMVLDYIFISPMNMGIRGAALATGLGFCVPAIIGLYYFSKDRGKQLSWTTPKWKSRDVLQAMSNGSSELVTNLSIAVVTFLINYMFITYYGDAGVAAITIILYFQYIFMAIYMGYSFGAAPLVSYKFGEQDWDDMKRLFKYSIGILIVLSLLAIVGSVLLINPLLNFFTMDNQVIQIAQEGFIYFAPSLALMSISIFGSSFFTALSDGKTSAIISFLRTFVFLAISLVGLPLIIGKPGLWLATTIAEVLGLFVTIAYFAKWKDKFHYWK